jgi:hypothetical protein
MDYKMADAWQVTPFSPLARLPINGSNNKFTNDFIPKANSNRTHEG